MLDGVRIKQMAQFVGVCLLVLVLVNTFGISMLLVTACSEDDTVESRAWETNTWAAYAGWWKGPEVGSYMLGDVSVEVGSNGVVRVHDGTTFSGLWAPEMSWNFDQGYKRLVFYDTTNGIYIYGGDASPLHRTVDYREGAD